MGPSGGLPASARSGPGEPARRVRSLRMDDDDSLRTDIAFALADACWRHAIAEHLGAPVPEEALTPPEMRGEPDTALRLAYEERRRAFEAWRRARGLT